jgi:uncharacterized protein
MNLGPFIPELRKLCRDNNIAMLGVFGSVARGDDEPESDVDLLIKPRNPISLLKLIQLEDRLQGILGRNVDLATENSLHPLIEPEVRRELKIIYES